MGEIDWSRPYVQVCGASGVAWTQDNKYFNGAGVEVTLEGGTVDNPTAGQPQNQCTKCDFIAKSSMGLVAHMRVHK